MTCSARPNVLVSNISMETEQTRMPTATWTANASEYVSAINSMQPRASTKVQEPDKARRAVCKGRIGYLSRKAYLCRWTENECEWFGNRRPTIRQPLSRVCSVSNTRLWYGMPRSFWVIRKKQGMWWAKPWNKPGNGGTHWLKHNVPHGYLLRSVIWLLTGSSTGK